MAHLWQNLEFADGIIDNNDVLSRISIQFDNQESCSVVLHSTTEFALRNTGVYGSSSSAARVGDASSDSLREEEIIDMMLNSLGSIPIPHIPAMVKSNCAFGPLLHRWVCYNRLFCMYIPLLPCPLSY